MPPESTEPDNPVAQALFAKIESIDGQCAILKQALTKLADAVADEIEEVSKGFDAKINLLDTRVQFAQIDSEHLQNTIRELKEMQPSQTTMPVPPSQLAETENKLLKMKTETRKLLD